MRETSKTITRRTLDHRFAIKYFVGDGIDIGAGNDSLGHYAGVFPLMRSVRDWDVPDGDAMLMAGVPDEAFDFVHSSHCLEHLADPHVALSNWIRICRPGGYLVLVVPDEDLYEQGRWPSTFSPEHRWTFTISKRESWCAKSINVVDLIRRIDDRVDTVRVELVDHAYLYGHDRFDQTHLPVTEAGIEIVLRKRTPEDIARKGIYPDRDVSDLTR